MNCGYSQKSFIKLHMFRQSNKTGCYSALGLEHFSWFNFNFVFVLNNEEAYDHSHIMCHMI